MYVFMRLKYFSLILLALLLFFISSASAMSLDDSYYGEFDSLVVDSGDTVVDDSMDVDLDDSDFEYSDSDDSNICVDDLDDDIKYTDKDIISDDFYYSKDYKLSSDFDSSLFSSSVSSLGASKTSTVITASNLTMSYYDGHKLIATIKTSSGKAISGLKVTFTVNGVTYNRTSNASGKVVLGVKNGIPFAPGNYSCVIKFAGTSAYAASSKTVKITINKWGTKLVANNYSYDYGVNGKLVATLQNSSGKAISGKSINFTINGKSYSVKTNSSGKATLDLSGLDPGSYSCVIKYVGDKVNNTCSKTVTVTVNKVSSKIILDNAVERGSNCVLVAKLVDKNNKSISNKILNFVFNNDSFEVMTDSSGNAVLDVSSVDGDYFLVYVKFEGDDCYGGSNKSSNVSVLNGSSPFVWASNGSGVYNGSFYVNLSSLDNFDNNPTIFYTLDGTLPTIFSSVYNGSIFISNQSNHTILRFFAIDDAGYQSSVVCVHYFFGNFVVNLNNGKIYNSVQSAIDDDETSVGDVIEVSCNLNESVVLNKRVYLRGSTLKEIFWTNDCSDSIISFEDVDGAIVEGFIFVYRSPGYSAISLVNSSNCFILSNVFFNTGFYSIYCCDNYSVNNSVVSNRFFGNVEYHIFVLFANNYLFVDNIFNNSGMLIREYYRGISDSLNFSRVYSYYSGIFINYSFNSVFKDNVFVKGGNGIYIVYGDNNSMSCNDISLCDNGIIFCGDNNELVNNTISRNGFGVDFWGYGNSILSNNIVDNQYGVYSNDSDNLSVNWNRFSSNSCFGLYVLSGSVNATHNWWGRSNVSASSVEGSDIYYTSNMCCIYEPYLIMKLIRTDFTIVDGGVDDCCFVVDLNWDSDDVYVRNFGHVADGAEVSYLSTLRGNRPISVVTLKSGVAVSTHIPSSKEGYVWVYLDNEYQEFAIGPFLSDAVVSFNTSAYVLNNSFSNFSFFINLTDSVDWVSFVWKDLGNFKSEVNVLVNGDVFKTFVVESSFYHNNPYNVSDNVFKAINKYNSFLYNRLGQVESVVYVFISLDYGVNTLDEVEDIYFGSKWRNYSVELKELLLRTNEISFDDALLRLIKNSYNLSDYELDFVRNHHDDVMDSICVNIDYYGDYSGVEEYSKFLNNGATINNLMATNGSDMAIRYLLETFAEPVVTDETTYEVGQEVHVIDGPFNGFNGVVAEVDNVKQKMTATILVFGRETSVELDFTQVERV